jgi:hypothetical protein
VPLLLLLVVVVVDNGGGGGGGSRGGLFPGGSCCCCCCCMEDVAAAVRPECGETTEDEDMVTFVVVVEYMEPSNELSFQTSHHRVDSPSIVTTTITTRQRPVGRYHTIFIVLLDLEDFDVVVVVVVVSFRNRVEFWFGEPAAGFLAMDAPVATTPVPTVRRTIVTR